MEDRYRPVIIGAGMAGNSLAVELTNLGEKPIVIESRNEVSGKACSGLVSKRIADLIPLPKEVVRCRVKKAILHFPSTDVEVSGKEQGVVVDRDGLLEFMKKKATEKGADYLMNENFLRFVVADKVIGRTDKRTFKTDVLVAADGANSAIRKKYGMQQRTERVVQAFCEHEAENAEIFLGKEYGYPFGYVVPYGEGKSIIGLGGSKEALDKFIGFVGAKKTLKYQAGLIPVGLPRSTAFERVLLMGDAAGFVKPFSGGSIVINLLTSKIAAKAIRNAYEFGDFSTEFFTRNFENKWRSEYMHEFKRNFVLRKLYENMNERDLESAGNLLKNERVMSIISESGDIDFYSRMVLELIRDKDVRKFGFKMLASKPWLLGELFHLI